MLFRWALIFFVLSIVSAILGFTGIVSSAVTIARFVFVIFLTLFLLAIGFGGSLFGRK